MSHTIRRRALAWGAWTFAALFFASQSYWRSVHAGVPVPAWQFFFSYLIGIYIIAALAPFILWPNRRWPIEGPEAPARFALHVAISVIFSFTNLAVAVAINGALHLTADAGLPFMAAYRSMLMRNFHAGIFLYWLLVAGDYALRHVRGYRKQERLKLRSDLRAAKLQKQLAVAQLAVMKAQLQPHFLFNTLNAVATLVRTGRAAEAEKTLGLLADMLRHLFDSVTATEVALHRELHLVSLYLDVERVRFGERLSVTIEASDEAREASVPHLGLQPLVENAVRHGIERKGSSGRIAINCRREGDRLMIKVSDNGAGLADQRQRGFGVGLRNTAERLSTLYGAQAQLAIEANGDGGVCATIVLPFRRFDELDDELPVAEPKP